MSTESDKVRCDQMSEENALTWESILVRARERLQGICFLCKVCDGRACAGQIPGIGGVGTGSSFINNVSALGAIRLNMRTLHDVAEPALESTIFGHKISMPILGGAVAGAKVNFQGRISTWNLTWAQVEGAHKAGTIALTGDGPQPEEYTMGLEAIKKASRAGIPIIKPRKPEEIMERIRLAEEVEPVAVGIDVDAAGLLNMRRSGQFVGPLNPSTLEKICSSTKLPVVAKGIMTKDEAVVAHEAGAAGIVVSNHGGRVLDHTPGTAEVLPEIADAVKGKITVMADGGARSGTDVLKFLALGADAVLIGRPVVWALMGSGVEGIHLLYKRLASELEIAMILTGCRSPRAADGSIIYR